MSKPAILCVDDEAVVLDSLKIQRQPEFGEAYFYEFADKALEIIEERHKAAIDILVIVFDWLMPGMKVDLFLRSVPEKIPNIIKVMLTGRANDDTIERGHHEACRPQSLHKSWDGKELIGTIKSGLAKL